MLDITVIIAVKNEEENIGKCLDCVSGKVRHIFVVDSQSTDGTRDMVQQYTDVELIDFEYSGNYPKKRQWALNTLPIKTKYIMLLDADEFVPEKLWVEIGSAVRVDKFDAYTIVKGYHFLNKRLRYGGFSFAAVMLFKKGIANFEELSSKDDSGLDMEVHERVIFDGNIGCLKTHLIHDDYKGLTAYIDRHNKYSSWEADLRFSYLKRQDYGASTIKPNIFGNQQERRRFFKMIVIRFPFEPLAWFLYHYVFRLGFLDGRYGYYASLIRMQYIQQVRAKIFEKKLNE